MKIKKGKIFSSRVIDNLKRREEISEKRRSAANNRWDKDGEKLPEPELGEDDVPAEEREKAKQFYLASVMRQFDRWLEKSDTDSLLGHNVYDYRELFKAVVEEVRTKNYVVIGRKNIPTFRFLQVIQRNIKENNEIQNLDQAIRDVETRYAQGKIRNKTNYLIATLYNTALMDNL